MKSTTFALMAMSAMLAFASCKKTDVQPADVSSQSLENKISENGNNPDEAIFSTAAQTTAATNYFYMESNKKSTNTILVFSQNSNGQIILNDEVKSGGYGTSEGLGSQGSVAVSREYDLLFAVNAGSNSVSSFRINKNTGGLTLLFTAYSYGNLPNSVTVYKNKLYILNNLSSDIYGYTFTANGFMTKIDGISHELSGEQVDAPQIKFQPDGKALIVTEKATSIINKFLLDDNGAVVSVQHIQSTGAEPFGFDFGRNNHFLVVTNAANGSTGAGSCTSYSFSGAGLNDINGAVGNLETAPCWAATTKYGAFAFTANTGSNNVSSYYIDANGALTLIKPVAASDGKKPIDIAVSADNRYVYNIYSGSHSLVAYKRLPGGTLEFADKVTAIPDFAAGLATY